MIYYNLIHSGSTFLRAAGRSLSVGRERMEMPVGELIQYILLKKVEYLKTWLATAPDMLGQYVMPAMAGKWGLAVSGLILALFLVWFSISVFMNPTGLRDRVYLCQFSAYLILLILFQWVADLYDTRHLLPLLFVIPVALFFFSDRLGRWDGVVMGVMGLLCLLQTADWVDQMKQIERDNLFDPKPVADLMKSRGIGRFYGSYQTTYPIVFVAKGAIVGSPLLLPYQKALSDRRPDYTEQVRRSSSPAFVFASDEKALKEEFQKFLVDHQVVSQSVEVNGISVYFGLSRTVDAVVKSRWRTTFALRDKDAFQ
jgi:hypothetical protein